MRIAVLGAGAWGTALAQHAARAHDVKLWARDPLQARAIAAERRNLRYLPGCELAPRIEVEPQLARALGWLADAQPGGALLVLAVPVSGLRPLVGELRDARLRLPAMVWLCKGLERGTGLLPHQVVSEALPGVASGALSGPSFAQEVAAALPVALVAASPASAVTQAAVHAFHHGSFGTVRCPPVQEGTSCCGAK